MQQHDEIIVFGCGGVGSWVANFVSRNRLAGVLSLVDFDTVEAKNLARQNFHEADIGSPKAKAAQASCVHYQAGPAADCVEVLSYERKIMDELDLEGFNKEAVAVIATDNIQSKRLIANHFPKFLIANCDKNFVEVKNHLDDSDIRAWDLGGGYSNEQDIVSNLFAAILITYLLKTARGVGVFIGAKRRFVRKIEDDFSKGFVVMQHGS